MTDNEYLKPCPFCGENGEEIQGKAYKARINAKKQLEQSLHTNREQMPFWRKRDRQARNKRNGGHKED